MPIFWRNLGLGPEWAALSAATQAAVSELPLAALRELADLTSDVPSQSAAATAKIDGPSQQSDHKRWPKTPDSDLARPKLV